MLFKLFISLLLLLLFSACSPPEEDPTMPADVPPLGDNQLITAEGDVLLKRSGWTDFFPTSEGTALAPDDQIWPSSDTQSVILCADLTTWFVPPGEVSGVSNGCPPPDDPPVDYNGSLIINTRDGSQQMLPYVISPRATQLLSQTPLLRWNDTGADSYTLKIQGAEFEGWTAQVSTTEWAYPGEPPLRPGQQYRLMVTDSNNRKAPVHPKLVFEILDRDTAQQIQTTVSALNQLDISAEAKALATVRVYLAHGLMAEAAQLLEPLAEQDSPWLTVHHALGDVYARTSLMLLAKQPYLTALVLAEQQNDLESVTAIQAGLGRVYSALGQEDNAVASFAAAQTGYQTLGDDQQAQEMGQEIEALLQ